MASTPVEYDAQGKPLPASQSVEYDAAGHPISANTSTGEGTYPMWDTAGHKVQVPYSQVPVKRGQGFQFDTNPYRGNLTPAQAFAKDEAADPNRTGGTSLTMAPRGATWNGQQEPQSRQESIQRLGEAEKNAPLPMRLITGVAKGGATLAKPAVDAINLATGQNTPAETSQMMAPQSTAEAGAKYATVAAPLIASGVAAPAATAGGLLGGAAGGYAGGAAGRVMGLDPNQTELFSDIGGIAGGVGGARLGRIAGPLIRSAAIGDPDVPLTRGLGITARTKTGLSALKSAGEASPTDVSLEEAQGARPYGQGAKNLADLQDKLTSARSEINQPLNQALSATSNKRVMGPDGPTTVGDLEAERVQLSAQLRGLQQKDPLAVQTALQKGLGEADLKNRYDAVVGAMTPHLDATGIDSRAIRMQDAQVASTLGRVAGRTTIPEEPQPYGFGKLQNIANFGGGNTPFDLLKPAKTVGNAFRDVLAGKPLWSGRPTDVNIQQGFSSAGPKPLLDAFDAAKAAQSMGAFNPPPRMLASDVPGNAPYGEEPYAGSMNGMQERNPVRVTMPPPSRQLLPEAASQGETQPMIRYATPYAEPYDPGLRPFSPPEYLKPAAPYNAPLIPKPTQGAQ